MHDDLIQVHTDALRAWAGDLAGTSHRLGHGLRETPGLTVPAPEWTAAEALAALESGVHAYLATVGDCAARTAAGLRAAAEEYDAADDRAARRLSATC